MPSSASGPPPKVSSCSACSALWLGGIRPTEFQPSTLLKQAREAAGYGMNKGLSDSPLAEGMKRFLLLVYAGLTGSVTMISCTVLALTRLFFEFKGEQEPEGWGTAQG